MHKKIILSTVKVADIRNLIVDVPTVLKQEATISELLHTMIDDYRTRHVYVVDDEGKLIGSVRMNMVVQYLFPMETVMETVWPNFEDMFINFSARTVKEIMKKNPFYVYESDTLSDMAKILMKEKINELPVVDKDMKLIGQVNVYEAIKSYLESAE